MTSPRGDQRTGGVAEAHLPLQVPAGEQPVAQRPAEGVAGPQDVERHLLAGVTALDDPGPAAQQDVAGGVDNQGGDEIMTNATISGNSASSTTPA